MATSAEALDPPDAFRWWFLPSWLGLDAPCVVSTWTWATSRALDVPMSFRPAAAMFLVVWSIYLSDRLVDVARCTDWSRATGRLHFGRRHRSAFAACLGVSIVGLAALAAIGLPTDVLRRGIYVALALAIHALAFVTPVVFREKLPGKEFGVGLFFALGTYACLGYAPGMGPLLVWIGVVVAFNCLVIAARDADCDRTNDPGGASLWWRTMKRDLFRVGVVLTFAAGVSGVVAGQAGFHVAVAAALLGLTILHRRSDRLSGDAVRALADFAILTPLPEMGVGGWLGVASLGP
jgi:hypothetical protein